MEKDELRSVVCNWEAFVYRAIKEGRVHELPDASKVLAKVIQQHLELPHIHNALEFADVRGGTPYLVNVNSPLAHLMIHAAVEQMIETPDARVKAAYEKLLQDGNTTHHAVHILAGIFLWSYSGGARAIERDESPDEAEREFDRALKQISISSDFRKKLASTVSGDHPFLESDHP